VAVVIGHGEIVAVTSSVAVSPHILLFLLIHALTVRKIMTAQASP